MSDSDDDSEVSFKTAEETSPSRGKTIFPITSHELSSLETKLNRIVYIQQADAVYHKAISDMRNQMSISLVAEPSFYGRHRPVAVLVVATTNQTYVFDIQALGAIFPELVKLLEAEHPRKVVHYSHRIADQLLYKHRINLKGVSDTFVALCVARQDRSPFLLQEAISSVFNIPLIELLCEEVTGVRESRKLFTARPLSVGQLRFLGRMAILQNQMHDRLIFGNICAGMQRMSATFSQSFCRFRNGSDVAMYMGPKSRFGFQCIDPYYNSCADFLPLPEANLINHPKKKGNN
ncbi:protein Exd1 homolog [Drosophila obscura]|uniref:protein Exd1 homolog n=1 Tax=Drosophila obscura TaxID=7282 RepID=UPI001BB28298|nr:protein Exd1 homolog [Drosophila obscura]XP_022225041.2 protein Exd1 homolog [Drosophila obscura]XP_022225043.2 protein Exd1 homolog [Drosophila obscura]XP_022225044.2 protein Exd1 homolog [Drosophila obscura]XP_022225045.2 protein Exd1 homolog [Drosophila obscura]